MVHLPRGSRASLAIATLAFLSFAPSASAAPAAKPDSIAARISHYQIPSRHYGRDRGLWVVLPPHYDPHRADGYDLLIAFDGAGYLEEIPLPRVLDSLSAAHVIPPTLAVLIDNATGTARLGDLANQPQFVQFLADEVVPWARKRWRLSVNPHRATLTGSSAGGLAATYVAFARPDVFGNVFTQSGAFWRGAAGSNQAPWEWLTHQIESAPKRDVRFALDVGALETRGALGGQAPSILSANRRLRDVMRSKGYELTYTEVEGGHHDPADWARRLAPGLASLAKGTP